MKPFSPPAVRLDDHHDVLVHGEPAVSMLALVFGRPDLVAPTFGTTNLLLPKGAGIHRDYGIEISDGSLLFVQWEGVWADHRSMTYKQLRRRAWPLDAVPCLGPDDLLNVTGLNAAAKWQGAAEGLIRLVILVAARKFEVKPWPETIAVIQAVRNDGAAFARLTEWSTIRFDELYAEAADQLCNAQAAIAKAAPISSVERGKC